MKEIIARLQQLIDECSAGNASNFAKLTNIPYSTLHGYLNGRMPHSEHLIRIRDKTGVSIDWILTGKGGKYCDRGTTAPLDTDPEIASMLKLAKKVLTSGNPIAYEALEKNIKYFAHAVDAEIELQQLKDDVKLIKDEITRIRRENLRLDTEAEEQLLKRKAG